jgi:uncharacterized protein YdgA (DUF945 family)
MDAGLHRAEGELHLASLALLEGDVPLLQLRGLQTSATGGSGPSGLSLGESSLTLEEGSFVPPDLDEPLRIRGLEAQVRSGMEGEMVWVSAVYSARELEAGGERFGSPQLELRTDRLSAPVLARIDRDLRELRAAGNSAGVNGFTHLASVMANMARLLEGDPVLTLERLYLESAEGAVEGRLSLTLAGLKPIDMLNPQRWIEGLDGSGELAIPEALLQRLLAAQLRAQLKDDPALVDTAARGEWVEDEVRRRIEQLVRQDLFQRRDGRLHTELSIGAGLLTVNGRSIPLSLLAQLSN